MSRNKTWFLLEQEGLLARACLCNGLTALGQANLGDRKGFYYSAFFELSIGFERMMKLVLILDHMSRHHLSPPDDMIIKNYGHKLRKLFHEAESVSRLGLTTLNNFPAGSLAMITLEFLDGFADTSGRYSNINKLTRNKHQAVADPLRRWGEIADLTMRDLATVAERKKLKRWVRPRASR